MSKPVQALTEEDIDEMISCNTKSALFGMQTAVAHFKKAGGGGHVINVSSVLGRLPMASARAAYRRASDRPIRSAPRLAHVTPRAAAARARRR